MFYFLPRKQRWCYSCLARLYRTKHVSEKSVLFQQLLPVIKQYQQSGFTHERIVELLKDQHDLNLVTVKTFKSYLYRYAKVNPAMSKNTATLQSMPTSREIKKHRSLSMFAMTFADLYERAANEMEEQGHKSLS